MGLTLINECPCSDFTAQPELKGEKKKRAKGNITKTKSVFLDIHKGSTYGHLRQETIEI